ncbi:Disease resistance protein [Corchorus olitorius]|uniref:Disease resistance protein n=1 Tax=Corchorus olitorius TaxID=93759 RepID=A0A1R3KJE7_9ROSI|nr:Disease resistance protein [Corchorus olitorius]
MEIETEASHSQKKKKQKVDPEIKENIVSQAILQLASTLTLSKPAPVEVIPSVKDDDTVMDEAMAEIISQPEKVPHQTGVAGLTTFEQNVSKILECMATDAVSRIVVYGVCGVGKSSVLRALVDDPNVKREFDLIIWILKGNKFLLSLDDVWEWIDPQEIGVPDPCQENGSMMILATRELKVYNHEMKEIRKIDIEPVSQEEAWKLFLEQVGGNIGIIDLPSIHHFAQGIVEKCCGLPLLIIITGRALADETNVHVWEHAFNEFSVSGRDIKFRIEDLIELLKFNFHQLMKSPSSKSCFLYCALVSQDQEIDKKEFIEYCIQEHLITRGWSNAYSSPGHDMVDALLRTSLLETNDREIGDLTSLRHLEVSFYGSSTSSDQVKLPRELISSLQSLETLRISVYPGDNWWKKNVGSFVKEVRSLKRLTSIYLPQVESLQLFLQTSAAWENETLREFKFVVGHDIKFNTSRIPQYLELNYGLMSGQCLRFVNSTEKKIPDAIVTVLSRCSAFYLELDHHLDICKLSEFGIGNLTKLKYCIISECPKLEAIVDSKDIGTQIVFQALEHLNHGASESGSISLESLILNDLPELVNIWEGTQTKLLFENITVYDCPQLKQMTIDSELEQTLKKISGEQDWWDELKWEENELRSKFEAIFNPIQEGDVHTS